MKTPIQELIEELKELQKTYAHLVDSYTAYTLHDVIELAESKLEKEKEVMCQFQSDGQRRDFWVKYEDNDDCFDKTFNTKEK